MIILITNDDGFDSEGIRLLKEIAHNFASEVWIVAPDTDRSGSARSLDYPVKQSIRINQHSEREFSVSGTPADCVIIALNKIMNKKPDLILSGVNIGSNVGDDICYSGTIGAAMEGAARSIPSIALSQVYHGKIDWNNTKIFAPKVIAKLMKVGWPKDIVMSINFPATEKVKGVEFAEQGEYNIDGDLTFTENLNGSLSLNWSREHSGNGSINKIKGGFITITPIKLDFTDYDILNAMKNSYAEEFSSIANTPIASD
ncbi:MULTISPECIES: 5'/3'-nucleotidase SurE [Wolbachia]|uniref:5'/3'-nucleotidase SurE n=1 Tax=Wolbachia TaxID=953 RepID=UPI002020B121|nr:MULTISPECIES: 5'/3'-nucleotidase SurE [unclassified Wolbachia]URG39898.1 5'/3'-nucleotidase SurE [Wolbachia endosymbiont of Ostrinia furnacalis]URG40916.1 5'/3'-nucleotidase SurE [Wolbachia endosymbiont of Ostrinia scapulalis]